jgi:hypothetical protein
MTAPTKDALGPPGYWKRGPRRGSPALSIGHWALDEKAWHARHVHRPPSECCHGPGDIGVVVSSVLLVSPNHSNVGDQPTGAPSETPSVGSAFESLSARPPRMSTPGAAAGPGRVPGTGREGGLRDRPGPWTGSGKGRRELWWAGRWSVQAGAGKNGGDRWRGQLRAIGPTLRYPLLATSPSTGAPLCNQFQRGGRRLSPV